MRLSRYHQINIALLSFVFSLLKLIKDHLVKVVISINDDCSPYDKRYENDQTNLRSVDMDQPYLCSLLIGSI